MRVLICAGHTTSGKGTGAVGYINESNENRILSKKIVEYLKNVGHAADYYEVNKADDYLQKQASAANSKEYDLVVQIHFNAHKTTNSVMGTETLYSSNRGKPYAEKVTNKLGTIYKQRGAKLRDDLYWLNKTKAPAILVETCFVDSKGDTDIYNSNKDRTAKLIAEAIHGKEISSNPNTSSGPNKYKNGDYNRKAKTTANLNIRTERNTSSKIVKTIPKGTVLEVNYCLDNWFSTYDYKYNNNPCYVFGDYIEFI